MTPRGIRLNNPGNIRLSRTLWQGEAGAQNDPEFISFAEPMWGLRAIARILSTYQRNGLDTVRKMVGRWAPPSENNTDAYVRAVARGMGVDPDASVDLRTPGHMVNMILAIVLHENGEQPYDLNIIEHAVGLAQGVV